MHQHAHQLDHTFGVLWLLQEQIRRLSDVYQLWLAWLLWQLAWLSPELWRLL